MNINEKYWMLSSIEIANKSPLSNFKVGAILVSNCNKLICTASSGEQGIQSWCSICLNKLKKLDIVSVEYLYLTINTLCKNSEFDLNKFLEKIDVKMIYIGMPDPSLQNYLKSDPFLRCNNIYRYPDDIQRKIIQQNKKYFEYSEQSIIGNQFYFDNRISSLLIKNLAEKGLSLNKNEININKSKESLAHLLVSKYRIEYSIAEKIISEALSEAFNAKYGFYDYSKDTRFFSNEWTQQFLSVYNSCFNEPLSEKNIVNVGVGNADEALELFNGCYEVTFVDIAKGGLKKIKQVFPHAQIIQCGAENLYYLPNNHYDVYISLRTYNSSFFDIKAAFLEAYRVLKPKGTLIISIANGFLHEKRRSIIPGLIIPQTEFVDIYRGLDLTRQCQDYLHDLNFVDIKTYITNIDIYISAVKNTM